MRVVVDAVLVNDGRRRKFLLETGDISGISEIVLTTREEGDGEVDLSKIVARGVMVAVVLQVFDGSNKDNRSISV